MEETPGIQFYGTKKCCTAALNDKHQGNVGSRIRSDSIKFLSRGMTVPPDKNNRLPLALPCVPPETYDQHRSLRGSLGKTLAACPRWRPGQRRAMTTRSQARGTRTSSLAECHPGTMVIFAATRHASGASWHRGGTVDGGPTSATVRNILVATHGLKRRNPSQECHSILKKSLDITVSKSSLAPILYSRI